jgi:hypothetical protein
MDDSLPEPQPNTEDVRYEIEPEGFEPVWYLDGDHQTWCTDMSNGERFCAAPDPQWPDLASVKRVWQRLVREMAAR